MLRRNQIKFPVTFLLLEVVHLESEVEVEQGHAVWKHENWCLRSSITAVCSMPRAASPWMSRRVAALTRSRLQALLKRRCCQVLQLLDILSVTNKTEIIYFDSKDKIA